MAKREEILNTALEIVSRVGYSRATVRELAQAVGLSQTGLLHYFGTKEQLFVEILRRRDEVDEHVLAGGSTAPDGTPLDLPGGMSALLRHNAQVPGLVQLYSRFSSEATEENHPAHGYFQDRYASARSAVGALIRREQEAGSLPDSLDADRAAVLLFALMDGLQTQWMYDPEIDMADQLAYFFELLSTKSTDREAPAATGNTAP
ncbi:TetR family transcriptional regulator [Streptomyces mangrovisoli]|uniref:TetR family transcriptional regulator n=1 Tax=Streptomyces mangrovisoli TaxID=1428628 RepID=A0A1J4NSM7_9ACTN|nr:TetR family transcriptional regulator [Streptomyces mangrovisoli]